LRNFFSDGILIEVVELNTSKSYNEVKKCGRKKINHYPFSMKMFLKRGQGILPAFIKRVSAKPGIYFEKRKSDKGIRLSGHVINIREKTP